MKTISFGLNTSDIDRAIGEVRKYQSDLTYKCQKLAERLAKEGVAIARVKVAEFDAICSSELLSSIRAEYAGSVPNGATWLVVTDCGWSAYVEFGTGVIGMNSPHPNTSLANWKYDVNEHGDMGWYYFKDGAWHWTKGMPSRPFMYQTGADLRTKVESIAREVFASA